jgi:hypothetical protein
VRRWGWNFAAAVSLVLCIAAVVLWTQSRPYYHARRVSSNARFYVFRSLFGILELDMTECFSGQFPSDFPNRFTINLLPQGTDIVWNRGFKSVFGFGYREQPLVARFPNGFVTGRTRSFSVPLWAFVGVTSILPLLFLYRLLHAYRRSLRNGCLRCGYNLTGNISGLCPECGTPTGSWLKR